MATKFGNFKQTDDVFNQDDLTKYVKETSIVSLQSGATDGSIAAKLSVLEAQDDVKYIDLSGLVQKDSGYLESDAKSNSIIRRIIDLEELDHVSFADLSTAISGNISQELDDHAATDSVIGRIKTLAERDDISYEDLSATISEDVDQVLQDSATPDSILGRLSALEDTVGVINVEIQDILDANV